MHSTRLQLTSCSVSCLYLRVEYRSNNNVQDELQLRRDKEVAEEQLTEARMQVQQLQRRLQVDKWTSLLYR